MPTLELKPTHKAVVAYYEALAKFEKLGVKHEGAVSSAFEDLLVHCARLADRVLIPKYALKRKGVKTIFPDAAVVDSLSQVLRYGLWEAKDTDDDLEKEIKAKFKAGYPRDNILFQEPRRAILYQDKERLFVADLTKPDDLVHILDLFFAWRPQAFDVWEKAIEEFKVRMPELGASFGKLVHKERETNPKYETAFGEFLLLCRASLNPSLAESAVEEMIIQHLLTERIFRRIFNIGDFMERNVIAVEIEKVIKALAARKFTRDDFTKPLDHFYKAIEQAAETITDFGEKQKFLNTVYERFFQGFCVKVADTHGIVYTPQQLVDFMVASVEQVLKSEFTTSLADQNVHILDPFTGTGNFIVNIMQRIPKSALPYKYRDELHCNEVMLLPYYVASMNLEHAFYEATGRYEPFPGICLVDTFETAEKEQREFDIFTEANTERVKRQKKAPIRVIIGNPPYNAWQQDENDNNKNRKYPELDRRIRVTYSDDSDATLKSTMGDPYIRAFRWASDRIGESGIVCFVTNNGFLEGIAGDGIRKHLAKDFDLIYHLDLKGNARTTAERRRKEGGNVFSDKVRVGIGISLLVRKQAERKTSRIKLFRVADYMKAGPKQDLLVKHETVEKVRWTIVHPDKHNNWITEGLQADFDTFLPIGSKDAKHSRHAATVFRTYSNGVKSNDDESLYDFDDRKLTARAKCMAEAYSGEQARWEKAGSPKNVDRFIKVDANVLKWIRRTKKSLARGIEVEFDKSKIRNAIYRPYSKRFVYMERVFNEDVYQFPEIFPTEATEKENRVICTVTEKQIPFSAQMTNCIPAHHYGGRQVQCFPLYTYSEDGKHRRDNIPLSALVHFQNHYEDDAITRADIFHYVYALLHHPDYRARYAENLKRELPRVPLAGKADEFHAFAKAGKRLAELHVNYEEQKEYPLKHVENREVKLDWRVEAMKLNKDRDAISYNDFLTLVGVPPEVFEYRLGNRSALEWVIDQYRVQKDEHDNITSDPNRKDDEEYIVRLVGQVITVSLETVKTVKALPRIE